MRGDEKMVNFCEILSDNPVIGAIRNDDDLENVLNSDVKMVFTLYGNLMNIEEICKELKKNDKIVFVNIDMIEGLRGDKFGIEFIKEKVNPHGIISTNGQVLKHAKHLGIFTIQRLFILDSISIETGLSIAKTIKPDAIEILPGIAYKAVELIKDKVSQPLITGGLIYSQKDAVKALAAGVIGVSTSSRALWDF